MVEKKGQTVTPDHFKQMLCNKFISPRAYLIQHFVSRYPWSFWSRPIHKASKNEITWNRWPIRSLWLMKRVGCLHPGWWISHIYIHLKGNFGPGSYTFTGASFTKFVYLITKEINSQIVIIHLRCYPPEQTTLVAVREVSPQYISANLNSRRIIHQPVSTYFCFSFTKRAVCVRS